MGTRGNERSTYKKAKDCIQIKTTGIVPTTLAHEPSGFDYVTSGRSQVRSIENRVGATKRLASYLHQHSDGSIHAVSRHSERRPGNEAMPNNAVELKEETSIEW